MGGFTFEDTFMFAGDVRQGNEFGWQPWAATADWLGRLQDLARSGAGYLRLPTSAVEAVQATLRSTFHYVTDFRLKNSLTTRTSALDSLDGANTASALLNLRIHSNPKEQARYQRIVDSFNAVFPRIDVEVVEETPGSGVPDVRFRTGGAPVRMSQVSAGTQQILTLLVNLEARPNQVFFVEHPETHLHPHAIRAMRDVLRRASTESQVIIAIHDPRFVDPLRPEQLRRFWSTASQGTRVDQIQVDQVSGKLAGQIETALKDLDVRDVVFARSVLLVEDESQAEFIYGIAPTLNVPLDARGVSVVPVGGEKSFPPYLALVRALGMPFVALRDPAWGNAESYPPGTFFSFGMEIEEYLERHGLEEALAGVQKEYGGGSKRRAAVRLAPRLAAAKIPPMFREVLEAALSLATGEPAADAD